MKYFLLILTALFVMSCSSAPVNPGCAIEQFAASAVSSAMAKAMACTNPNQIQSDLLSALGKANFCSQVPVAMKKKGAPKGPIGNLICPMAVSAAVKLAAGKVPAAWGCSPDATVASVAPILVQACEALAPL